MPRLSQMKRLQSSYRICLDGEHDPCALLASQTLAASARLQYSPIHPFSHGPVLCARPRR